ncbi:MAG: acyltransferase, partial [Actinobacteria bacterium]|nr:acyltransferase [Actinomycetota bacterium]
GALAGLAGILVFLSAVASPYTWSDYGLTTGVAIATAALIAHVVVRPGGRVAAPLGWKPVAAIGRVSYGIYLYHWPITVWVGRFSLPLAVRAGAVYALTAVAVVASWFLVERPALRLKRRFARPRVEAQVMAAPSATQVKGALVHPMATGARQLPMAVADDGAE